MAAILNIQYGGHAGVCANANIDFWIRHVLNITKMYCFANPHKLPTKTHSEPDYTMLCRQQKTWLNN